MYDSSELLVKDSNQLDLLPDELLIHVLLKLSPEDIVKFREQDKRFNKITSDGPLWKHKFNLHFPALKDVDSNWFECFQQTYLKSYGVALLPGEHQRGHEIVPLDLNVCQLFSWVKEGDLGQLSTAKLSFIDLITYRDHLRRRTLLEWACVTRQQHLLDHFFNMLIEPYFTREDRIDFVITDPEDKLTIMHWAAICNQPLKVFDALSSLGGNVSAQAKTWRKQTPIYCAAKFGQLTAVKALLDSGVDVNEETAQGSTALIIAAENNQIETIDFLADNEADINHTCNQCWHTALYSAAEKRDTLAAKHLIDKGADPNQVHADQNTALIIAAAKGCLPMVIDLLEAGASINHAGAHERRALFHAIQSGNRELVTHLIANGADVTSRDAHGNNALHYAASVDQYEMTVELIKAGANTIETNFNNKKPFKFARGKLRELLELENYIAERNKQIKAYPYKFSLFGFQFFAQPTRLFGRLFNISRTDKLNAANAFRDNLMGEGVEQDLDVHQAALDHGRLGRIYSS